MTAASTSSLPRGATAPMAWPLGPYNEVAPSLPPEPTFDRPGRVLRLPAITIATLRYEAPPVKDLALATAGPATQASVLLAHWRDRALTAWSIAEDFQSRFYGAPSRGFRRGLTPYRNVPRKAFDLITATESLGYVQWRCDVEDPDDWRKYTTVRLSEALAMLAHA